MKISGKVVWLTGASSGIGEALAYALDKEGARLVLSARRKEELERVAAGLKNEVLVLPLDLEDFESHHVAVNRVIERFGRVDILINNGGVSQRSLARETPVAIDKKLMDVNYLGTVALTKAVLPQLLSLPESMIVTVTSAVGKFGSPWRSGYSASKHALHGFFDSLRAECYGEGLKVLLVCPGFVRTNVSVNALTHTGQKLGSMDTATSQGLTAEECALSITKAIRADKEEVVIGRFKENLGVFMKRFFPSVFSVMVRKMAVR